MQCVVSVCILCCILTLERFKHLIPVLYFFIQRNKNPIHSMPLSLWKTQLLKERRPNTVFLLSGKSFIFIFVSHTIYIE